MLKSFHSLVGTVLCILITVQMLCGQDASNSSLLTIDRIFNSSEFREQSMKPIHWIDGGDRYIIIEDGLRGNELIQYDTESQQKSVYLSASSLRHPVTREVIKIEDFTISDDGSYVMIFTNSSRVWRSNTKGDYWIYNVKTKAIKQIGSGFDSSSLMFAKFSSDNSFVGYVQKFNIYLEDLRTGEIQQLTTDGTGDVINGTFDWVYEEEFGCRDGFRINDTGTHMAFWQLDASGTGVYHMINNTDSIYPALIPVQYPKVGESPSHCRVGISIIKSKAIEWIDIPGDPANNYIPTIQWINETELLVQQLNRHQNHLIFWSYNIQSKELKSIYEEKEDTWVDLKYPDITANGWGRTDMRLADNGRAVVRLTEGDGWRHAYTINLKTGKSHLITPGEYDVASIQNVTDDNLLFMASPDNVTQRYLYHIKLHGNDTQKRLTPREFDGINRYNISPNGKFAIHSHSSHTEPYSVRLISLPKHETISTLVGNDIHKRKLENLALPEIEFFQVTTEEGVRIDGRMIKPIGFDETKKYPVLFHVYGEPWGQVAQDAFPNMWNIMLAQKGYIIIDMDNRGTPVLNGSAWRKSIYRKIGVINTRDQALAAKEVLKWDFVDEERTAVWGWSGGGSMTLNLMFQFPEIYQTGIAIAAVAYQLTYDNIYQERYMGLPQENEEDFLKGSPISHVENLEGNLLLIHGTADDNVHYQNAEMLINELIRHNKLFDLMIYPNRSHGIREGDNTTRHLYTKMTDYLLEYCPVNDH